ncbi:Type I inositol 1,4,5-trisphosphate 5-phosphatase 1 [Hibiscus syriacus]|uniref:Type I inositol 1,4,5-trisphosphate 5-phosphatase 1 n=1 Tax=Hibiscus syriacus TaxID=106335 RepID=A0A6A2YZQ3_HIBSY|nr:Type I inositol 1,4,5-trisphosphate 5-phosphatase 1 [Hibiscus syriacus]
MHHLKVSTVGVGVLGYIGNKGSVSVSMSIYQTLFCFICTHLTAAEKDGDEHKRNADVHEILKRTHFHSSIGLPKVIHDHELGSTQLSSINVPVLFSYRRIIWLGDLNYRIKLPHDKARELISKEDWSELIKHDQLVRELQKGRTFDGWSEGALNFAPTYKYGCGRILSNGKGMRQVSYRRTEFRLSDHLPVTAVYMAEVEVFCPRKLQRALTYTDAEIQNEEVSEEGISSGE